MHGTASPPGTPGPPTAPGRRRVRPPRIDPYVAALFGTAGLAALLPATGAAEAPVGTASNLAVAGLFFLHGARLSSRAAVEGLRHWRLHLTIAGSTFVLFPLLGLAARVLVPDVIAPDLYPGLLFLCLLPTTVQSAIGFTAIARGNVAAAICAGTYSSLLGMLVTPLLAAALLGSAVAIPAGRFAVIGAELLLPFLAGHALHGRIGPLLARRGRLLGLVDRGSVLLVVYTAFSQGMAQGIWFRATVPRLAALLAVEAVLLAVILAATAAASVLLGFGPADRVAIVFSGSKKSLVNGLPMAAVLFGSRAGLTVLPLMMFHQLQLVVCAVIARRWPLRRAMTVPRRSLARLSRPGP